MIHVGIAATGNADAFSAGQSAVKEAIVNGFIKKPLFCIGFCNSALDAKEFFRGIQSVVGAETPIIGGSAVGIITNNFLSYTDTPSGVMVMESDEITYSLASESFLGRDEFETGKSLCLAMKHTECYKMMLLFYDSIKQEGLEDRPPQIYASPRLISGIMSVMKDAPVIFGAGTVGDYQFRSAHQFCGSFIAEKSVVGMLLDGDFHVYSRIMHGCTPKDGIYHTITKADGPVVQEIDDRSIVAVIDEMYGSEEWQKQKPLDRLCLGVYHGEKFCDFAESYFVNRLIMGVLPDRSGILLFEPDLEPGSEVLFMLRDNIKMITSVKENAVTLMQQIGKDGKIPVAALYIDCAGRTAKFSHTFSEEAAEVQIVCNQQGIPLFGFYSGVEIAPLLGRSRGLDWTGVLLVLARKKGRV